MLIVAALGGNAVLRRHESVDAEAAPRNMKVAVGALAEIARDHQLVVTHGNGPQIGLLAPAKRGVSRRAHLPARCVGRRERGHDGLLARA